MSHKSNPLSIERARELFSYDPNTGVVTRKVAVAWTKAGAVVGCKDRHGHLRVHIDGAGYGVHRLAWALFHGVMPSGDIDHINGDPSDNRIANLRDVPTAVNLQNHRAPRKDNRTGMLGVSAPRCGGYRATIGINGKQKHLGTFPTADQAHAAYLDMKRQLHEGCTI